MTEYYIIEVPQRIEMEHVVDAALAAGWVCQGGVYFAHDHYIQAMVREKP